MPHGSYSPVTDLAPVTSRIGEETKLNVLSVGKRKQSLALAIASLLVASAFVIALNTEARSSPVLEDEDLLEFQVQLISLEELVTNVSVLPAEPRFTSRDLPLGHRSHSPANLFGRSPDQGAKSETTFNHSNDSLVHLVEKAISNAKLEMPANDSVVNLAEHAASNARLKLMQDLHSQVKESVKGETLEDQRLAKCVLLVISASERIAKLTASMYNVMNTCDTMLSKKLRKAFGQDICAVNVQSVVTLFANLAGILASAVSTCAEKNDVDAICTASALGLAQALEAIALSGQIVSLSCDRAARNTNHVIGIGKGEKSVQELLVKQNLSILGSVAARRLLIGDQPQIKTMQCVLDALGAATSLAVMGTAIDGAVRAACPAKKLTGAVVEALDPADATVYNSIKVSECNGDISQTIMNVAGAATQFGMIPMHCTSQVNIKGVCSSGITTMVSGLVGISGAASGIYLTCQTGQPKYQQELADRTEMQVRHQVAKLAADGVLQEFCPEISLQCATDLMKFLLSPCGGGMNDTCPEWPSNNSCPGISSCRQTFESRPGDPWPPPDYRAWASTNQACQQLIRCLIDDPANHFNDSALIRHA